MRKNNKNTVKHLTLEQELDIVKNKLLDIDPNSSPELINDLQDRLAIIATTTKRMDKLLDVLFYICLFFLVLVVGLIITNIQSSNYQKELEDRLNIQLATNAQTDSLFNKYLDVDSNGTYKTRLEGGKELTYKDLFKREDSLIALNSKLKESISIVTQRLDMAKSNYGIYFTEKTVGNNTYITIGSKKLEQMDRNGVEAMKKIQPLLDSINNNK